MVDISVFQMFLLTVTRWLDRREREVLAYLIEENRVLRRQLDGRRVQLTDDDAGDLPREPAGWVVRCYAKSRRS